MANQKQRVVLLYPLLVVGCSATGGDVDVTELEPSAEVRARLSTEGPSTAGPPKFLQEMGFAPEPGPGSQIVGGAPASAGQYPWQVTFGQLGNPTQLFNDAVYPHFCGGSVIAERWIATAAHCVFGEQPNEILMKVGVLQRSAALDTNVEIRGAKSIVIHPAYTGYFDWQEGDDIALIELNEPLEFTSRVRPIALAAVSAPDSGNVSVTGWGRTDGSVAAQSDALNAVQLPIRTNAVCNAQFSWGTNPVKPAMMCAGSATGTVASCNGDSGGPVIYRANATDSWRQVGIVSWGQTGCTSYSVFTRVSSHYAWAKGVVPDLFRNGDVNRDGCVNSADLALITSNLNLPPPASNVLIDTNNDGVVNSIDYVQVANNFDSACP